MVKRQKKMKDRIYISREGYAVILPPLKICGYLDIFKSPFLVGSARVSRKAFAVARASIQDESAVASEFHL